MAGARSREAIDVPTVIKNNLTCRICLDIYKAPKGLPCQHAFCCKCLEGHIISSVEEGRKNFKCPLCKRTTRPPHPKKSKQTWAGQFKHDFKLTSLLHDLQQCVAETTLESEAVNDAGTSTAASTTASASTMRTSTIPFTEVEHTPSLKQQQRQGPSATSQNVGSTSHRDDAERVQYRDITSSSLSQTTDSNVLKDISSQALSGSVESCIVLGTGDQVSYDLTILVQGEKRIILAPNYEGKSLLAITLNTRLEEVSRCSFDLEATPIRISHLDNTTVAVTTSNPNAIALYNMQEKLQFQKRIQTKKAYDGIACLEDGLFVVTTGTDVDIVDRNGRVQDNYTATMHNKLPPDNCYVSVTPGGETIITDLTGHVLTCLKRDCKQLWQKKKKVHKNPMGTAVDSSGAIFVADHTAEAIVQLNARGSFVCNVVEKSVQFRKPSAIALDNMGYMFVICDYNFVVVVKLSENCDS